MKVKVFGKTINFTKADADLLIESLTVKWALEHDGDCSLCLKYDSKCGKCPLGGTGICGYLGQAEDLVGDIEDARIDVHDGIPGSTQELRNVRRRVKRILGRAVK